MKEITKNVAVLMLMIMVTCVTGCESKIVSAKQKTVDHVFVDLGLPSGTLWATCNIGASTPESYGDYFAWGETQPKATCNWSTYKFINDSMVSKYTKNDGLFILQASDDVASVKWGRSCHMPSYDEWNELIMYCKQSWITRNGVNGKLFTASNNNSIFLPAGGYHMDSILNEVGKIGYYWSSSANEDYDNSAYFFYFYSDDCDINSFGGRCSSMSVRPVCSVE